MWQGLIQLSRSITDEPWIVMGDFNAVLDDSEVSGYAADTSASMAEFLECITESELTHLPFTGANFTWHNCSDGERSLWKRLDRMLVNEVWLVKWPQSKYISTHSRTSDHSPLILQGQDSRQNSSMFRFENYMAKMVGFQRIVEEHWRHQFTGTDMYVLTRKLKSLKPIFRSFRKTHGDLSHNVEQAAHFLQKAQLLSQEFKHESIILQLEKCCRLIFCKATIMEVNMLKQRAKLAWLKGGDNCSKILFPKINVRRASQRVYQIQNDDGHILTDNTAVIAPVQRHEIKEALFDINYDSAPGLDGFSSCFFKATWAVVGEDVCHAVMEFFNHGRLLKQLNATLITLIPKVQLPTKEFQRLTGLHANAQKSQILFSKAALQVQHQIQSIFRFPQGVIKTIEAKLRNFLWRGGTESGGYKVAWEQIQIKAWHIMAANDKEGSWTWKKLLKLRYQLIKGIQFQVGDGTEFKLWLDPWHPDGTLIHRYPHGPLVTGIPLDSPLSTVITEGNWNWPSEYHIDVNEIIAKLPAIHSGANDTIIWNSSSGNYSAKDAYDVFSE
ncbi:hypothetical protein Sango_2888600 [Sesamum angolense]|uniref:Endonuclease/exonuclease/phosphatase domain-containing protein n=1 Tax=Sesamum angolense TaxID=2727404 RepID=A0AAE1VV71_9LAMI|nr:hypothetical protein Sango_2888600 [Sesamum angolense]